MDQTVLLETKLPGFSDPKRGKVRDIYDLGEHLLIVATDRISAFDVVMANGIPEKGKILTRMSVFWFGWIQGYLPYIRTHFVTADWTEIKVFYPVLAQFQEQLEGRSMLVIKVKILPVEAVVRGYLCGSGWKDYQQTGQTSGVILPVGLREADKLKMAIFAPATKAASGHDENIGWHEVFELVGEPTASAIKGLSLVVYNDASKYAASRGILIMDTKFEFGNDGAGLVLADEVLTPDSSRFVRKEDWQPGRTQPFLDKQFLREHLEGEVKAGRWDKTPPGPELPSEIVEGTLERYREALRMLVG